MSTPMLATKLYLPPPRPKAVLRPRLIERLDEGLQRKLTLLSAPAGFGKTTLVSAWLTKLKIENEKVKKSDQGDHSQFSLFDFQFQVAWLSLDAGDSELTRFLTYLVAALQMIAPAIGAGLLSALQSPQPPPAEVMLTALLNEIAAIPDRFVLVLDDYHAIDSRPVDQALTFLLDHLPPQLHLVITTREDPQLPLARLRARDQMTELRAADLRFTAAEAAAFLSQIMDLDLAAEQVSALETRTEGWIAGLQLAALSMRGRTDVAQFVKAFAGDNRYIVDYLVEEVLQRQPERVRSFLLQTAILDRLSGPLCDAVTGRSDGVALLDALERGNLFVVPLDDTRHWFRYHHLFGDMLAAHAQQEQPAHVALLHQRASAWYADNGLPADAIRHALAAKDFARAAGLVEREWPAMDGRFQSATWLGWARALPDELVRARPVLGVAYAWALLNRGELEAAEARFVDAEQWLDNSGERLEAVAPKGHPATEMVIVDEEQFRNLPASIATARAYIAQARGDIAGSITYGRRALDLLPAADHLRRGPAAALLGLAHWASGDLEAAYSALADAMAGFQQAGNLHFATSVTSGLADIRVVQGRLHAAASCYTQALRLALAQGEPPIRGTANLHLGLSELYHEQGNREVASQHLLRTAELGDQAGLPDWRYRFCRAQARFRQTEGDWAGALALLDQAERHARRTPVPDLRPLAALKVRVWLALGRLGEARRWAHEQSLSVDDELSFLRECEHITLARVLIAEHGFSAPALDRRAEALGGDDEGHLRGLISPPSTLWVPGFVKVAEGFSPTAAPTAAPHDAMRLLDRLQRAAEVSGRLGSVLEIAMLQALAHQAQGNLAPALIALERALRLAEPEGYVAIFVDEGPPMARLLSAAQAMLPDYIGKLLMAFPTQDNETTRQDDKMTRWQGDKIRAVHDQTITLSPAHPATPALVEPLSERELEVLRLLRTELNGPEIAHALMVSLNTMRTHTKNIYSKLGANNRRAAIRRAEELDLL